MNYVLNVINILVTLTWKFKCLKTLNICFFLSFPVFSCLFLFFSSSRNRVCVSAPQAQFPVFQSFQFLYRSVFKMAAIQWVTISVSNNLFICQRNLARFSVDFGFILLCTSLKVDWLSFFRATSLEMQYLDRWVFRI
jgi:hypothetical protein